MNIDYEIIEEPTYRFTFEMSHQELKELLGELADAEPDSWIGHIFAILVGQLVDELEEEEPDAILDEPTPQEQIRLGENYITRSQMVGPQPIPKTQTLEEFLEEHSERPSGPSGADIVGQLLEKLNESGLSEHAPSPVKDTIDKLVKSREEFIARTDSAWLDDGSAHR